MYQVGCKIKYYSYMKNVGKMLQDTFWRSRSQAVIFTSIIIVLTVGVKVNNN